MSVMEKTESFQKEYGVPEVWWHKFHNLCAYQLFKLAFHPGYLILPLLSFTQQVSLAQTNNLKECNLRTVKSISCWDRLEKLWDRGGFHGRRCIIWYNIGFKDSHVLKSAQ